MNILELEETPRPLLSDPLPSEKEMQEFRNHLESLREEKFNRFDKILQIRADIRDLLQKLDIETLNDYNKELVNNNNMKPTLRNIEKLEDLSEELTRVFTTLESNIESLRKRLSKLWKYLDIPEHHFRKFSKYTVTNQMTYDKLLAEVQRCELIKKENIRNFIEKVRVEIEEYWDKCLKSDAERLRFPSYTANIFNEDVLELHELELRDVKNFYESNEAIFKLIQERQDLWQDMEKLQNKESDPKRYNNRGGQLLKEEKDRKMIAIKLPKMEAKLIELVEKFEDENNRPFTMYGTRVQDIIERDYEAKRQEKITKSGKKVQATPGRTPMRVNMTGIRTPLTIEQTLINRTTAIKSTGARLRVATKSKLALSTTSSSTASSVASVRTDTGKRRLPMTKTVGPQAKRQLLGAFTSPGSALRQVNGNATGVGKNKSKNASLKVYNVGSCIKRRSRKSVGKKRRSSMMKSKLRPVPIINVSDTSVQGRDTTSYEGFEVSRPPFTSNRPSTFFSFQNYVYQSKSVVRSSEVNHQRYLAVNHHGFASPIMKKPATPASKRIGTPSASTPTQRGLQPKELEFSMII